MPAPRIFAHHMLREIYEQPTAIAATLDLYLTHTSFRDGPLQAAADLLLKHPDLIIPASGSSRHAGLAAEILLEDLAARVVDVEYASEYACRSSNTRRNPAVLVLSQSGETGDTLAALREAGRRGHPTIAITNVAHSTMSREADISLPTLAGLESAIPATKSFTAQLTVASLLALLTASRTGTTPEPQLDSLLQHLREIPTTLAAQLPAWEQQIAGLSSLYADARTFLYLGRGIHYAIAREGALKLKESSYLHAEGYPTGELKHGPNALVSCEVPLVVIATVDRADEESQLRYNKTLTLLEELKHQQGTRVLALCNAGDADVPRLATHTIAIEPGPELLLPITEVVPLQLFAYFMATHHGVDVDHPRNLSKAVLAS